MVFVHFETTWPYLVKFLSELSLYHINLLYVLLYFIEALLYILLAGLILKKKKRQKTLACSVSFSIECRCSVT